MLPVIFSFETLYGRVLIIHNSIKEAFLDHLTYIPLLHDFHHCMLITFCALQVCYMLFYLFTFLWSTFH